jgi:TRAP-type C4-dicarboxylate transport system substrate-binding protein
MLATRIARLSKRTQEGNMPGRFNRRSIVAAGIFAISGAWAAPSAMAQEKVSLSIAHIATLNVPNIKATMGALRDALEATGKVDVTLFGQGSAYSDPTKFTDLVRRGVVDIAFGSPQFEAGRYPLNNLIGEPFIAPDHVGATRAYWNVYQRDKDLQAEFSQVRLILLFCSSPEQFHGVKPIESLEALKGVRVMTSNQGIMALVQAVGGTTVALPTSAQYEQLQKGVVGASSSSWTGVQVFGTNDVTSGHLELNSVMTPNFLIINKDKYASLPPEVKKVIDDYATLDMALKFANVWTYVDKLGREGAVKKSASILTLAPTQRTAIRTKYKDVLMARIRAMARKGLPAERVYHALSQEATQGASR